MFQCMVPCAAALALCGNLEEMQFSGGLRPQNNEFVLISTKVILLYAKFENYSSNRQYLSLTIFALNIFSIPLYDTLKGCEMLFLFKYFENFLH